MWELWGNVLPVLFMLALGYGVGRWRERRHFASLALRERRFEGIVRTNLKDVPDAGSVERAALVTGDAVIATDYFKSFAAKLRNIVGGEVRAYETLMARARREASLRMLEKAEQLGASEVYNVRFETSNIRGATRRQAGVSVEVFAFGTAVARSRPSYGDN